MQGDNLILFFLLFLSAPLPLFLFLLHSRNTSRQARSYSSSLVLLFASVQFYEYYTTGGGLWRRHSCCMGVPGPLRSPSSSSSSTSTSRPTSRVMMQEQLRGLVVERSPSTREKRCNINKQDLLKRASFPLLSSLLSSLPPPSSPPFLLLLILRLNFFYLSIIRKDHRKKIYKQSKQKNATRRVPPSPPHLLTSLLATITSPINLLPTTTSPINLHHVSDPQSGGVLYFSSCALLLLMVCSSFTPTTHISYHTTPIRSYHINAYI